VSSSGVLGTGFLIGRQLIITNNHVLPTVESCAYVPPAESTPVKGVAQFFYEDEKKTIEVPLDGKSVFLTSQSPGKQSAKGEFLDFTVVSLATVPESDDLSRIYASPLSLFKNVVTPAKDDEAVMIQHPNGDKTQISWGQTRVITHDNVAVHYNTKAAIGSSGSPVLSKERRLFALHRLGKCPEPTHSSCNQGVLIKAVVAFLNKMKNPQDPQKTGFETIQEWLDEKDLPLTEIARRFWIESKIQIDQREQCFSKTRKEPFSRKKTYKCFCNAYRSLTEALKLYKNPQEANQKADKHKIEQLRDFVRWQKMVVALELAIPVFLPHPKDQSHPMLNLLRNPKESVLTLDKWLAWQQDQIKQDPMLESDPTICFLIAFVAEEFFDNEKTIENEKSQKIKLSAKWYLSLARSYHNRGDNIFLKRACLDKARALDPSIQSEKKYEALDKTFTIRENRFKLAFTEALKKLDSQSGSSKPSCFIFHDREKETEEWIEHVFYPHLKTVGSEPLYDKYNKKIKTAMAMVHFICEGIKDSKYVLLLCTPSLVEKEAQASVAQGSKNSDDLSDIEIVGYAFEMLYQLSMGAANSNILRLIQDGDSQESIPRTFAKRESFLFNTPHKYYENILRVLGIIKSPDDGGGEPASPTSVPVSVDGTSGDGGGSGNLVEQLISQLNMIDLGSDRMEALAASGDPEANFHLAQSYSYGHSYGIARYDVDLDKALGLYKKASSLEDGRAEVRLGQILIYQKGNTKEALEWFAKADQKGNLQALIEQQKYYRKEKDLVKEELFNLRIAEKIAEIQSRSRITTETKEKLIFEHNQELANKKNLLGMMGLAWCYKNGCGVAKDLEVASRLRTLIDWHQERQAEHDIDPPPVVEGRVLRSDPLSLTEHLPSAPSAKAQPVIIQPAAVESQVLRIDPLSFAENPPDPAALAKEPATEKKARVQLPTDILSQPKPSDQDAKSFQPAAEAIQQLKELQAKLQADAEKYLHRKTSISPDTRSFQLANEAIPQLKELQAKLQAGLEKYFQSATSNSHGVRSFNPAAWAKQQLKELQGMLQANIEKYLRLETPTSLTATFNPTAAIPQLKELQAMLETNIRRFPLRSSESGIARIAHPAAASESPQNTGKNEKQAKKSEQERKNLNG
jgi:hypothetical protein